MDDGISDGAGDDVRASFGGIDEDKVDECWNFDVGWYADGIFDSWFDCYCYYYFIIILLLLLLLDSIVYDSFGIG